MTKTQLKNQILASKVNSLRSDVNEASLRTALFYFFINLQDKILTELSEYWNDDFMVQGQIDLILAPIFESQKEYYDLLLKHNLKEFRKGKKTAKRLVKIAKRGITGADKAEVDLKKGFKASFTKKKEMFGTLQYSEDKLRNQTFIASESTMNRVDKDVNDILADGYNSGKGIAQVRDNITKRFTQLKTWEAERIARTEIHSSQSMGIMNGYESLGVEYIEWDSAHDMRVRGLKKSDKADHVTLSGEIIRLGDTFSNGLAYPGDRSGALVEWINCRCGNLPFIMPDGYTAPPGKMQFRENEIVKIDVEPIDDIINTVEDPLVNLSEEDKVFYNRWKRNYAQEEGETYEEWYQRLSRGHKTPIINKEYGIKRVMEHQEKSLQFLEKTYPKEYQKIYKEAIKPVDYNRLTSLQRKIFEDYKVSAKEDPELWAKSPFLQKRFNELEAIARDTTIYAEEVTLSLQDVATNIGGLKEEKFMKYVFKDKDYVIYISEELPATNKYAIDWQNPKEIIELLEKQPKQIRDSYKELIISNQRGAYDINTNLKTDGLSDTFGKVITFHDDKHRFKTIIPHEGAHNLDSFAEISSSEKYIQSTKLDHELRLNNTIEISNLPEGTPLNQQNTKKVWVSDYAEISYNKSKNLTEDWAESVSAYVNEPKWFAKNYPNKFNYIDDYFGNIHGKVEIPTPKPKPKVKGLDKYALTESETLRYNELKALKEKEGGLGLKLRQEFEALADRKEFNEMRNKILLEGGDPTDIFALEGAEGVRYERLYKKFRDWEPLKATEIKPVKIKKEGLFENKDAFKLTSEEKTFYKQAKKNYASLKEDEKEYYKTLTSKTEFNKLHKKLLETGLDSSESNTYLKLYSNYKKEWGLPELNLDLKFKPGTETWEWDQVFKGHVKVENKMISQGEIDELLSLRKKELLSKYELSPQPITESELSRIKELSNQREFNWLYHLNEAEQGLEYGDYVKYKKYFNQFKDKLKLDPKILENKLPEYNHELKPGKITNDSNPLKLKGTTETGLPPRYDIKDLFTVDVTKLSRNERRVLKKWMGNDFVTFRDYMVRSEGDVNKFMNYLLNGSEHELRHYHFVKVALEKGEVEKAKQLIRDIAAEIDHDLPVLDNILNNNWNKEAMTLWRVEERHHLGENPKKGDIVTFKGRNSTAITKEGTSHFSEVTNREMQWTYEIEAPVGTRGAYVSHLNDSESIKQEMEFLLAEDTKMEIISFDEKRKKAKLRIIVD